MRRAAIQALRTVRLVPVRRLGFKASSLPSSHHAFAAHNNFASSGRDQTSQILQASMYFRNFGFAAIVSGLVASGAWYFKEKPTSEPATFVNSSTPTGNASYPRVDPTLGLTTSTNVYAASAPSSSPQPTVEQIAESTRRALVVEDDQFYTGDIVGDEPLSKDTDDAGRKVLEMLTPEQATQKLRRNEESYLVGRGQGVVRYDVVQLPSNDPIEDDHAEKILGIPQTVAATQDGTSSSDWMFWGVFDGHSGWTTSAKLRQALISHVARELNTTYKKALSDPALTVPTPDSIDTAIKKGFVGLDHEIVYDSVNKVMKANSKRVAAELLAPALSGSCALLSFYDSRSKLLRVACTGDSRAVLGRRGTSGKWTATALSEDQTGGTPSEMDRLRKEHPGEEYVVSKGRILGGLEPSRAFGDAIYKWSRETQELLKSKFFTRSPSPGLRTPPYVTAEPIVTTTKVEPEKGDFVVMATDGLWEMLTNEEVVGLVGQWLESNSKGSISDSRSGSWLKGWFGGSEAALPVEKNGAVEVDGNGGGQRAPIRQVQWKLDTKDERFVVEDKNAATHLVRNALGGRDRDMVCALLTLQSPFARRYRDDLTVEVIFFGDGDKSGNVVQNREASASVADVKAKL